MRIKLRYLKITLNLRLCLTKYQDINMHSYYQHHIVESSRRLASAAVSSYFGERELGGPQVRY
jgi:hypothetical protein